MKSMMLLVCPFRIFLGIEIRDFGNGFWGLAGTYCDGSIQPMCVLVHKCDENTGFGMYDSKTYGPMTNESYDKYGVNVRLVDVSPLNNMAAIDSEFDVLQQYLESGLRYGRKV